MIKSLLWALAALLTASCGLVATPLPPTPPGVSNGLPEALAATVALTEGLRPYCAGVRWREHVLTAAHCVRGEEDQPHRPTANVSLFGDYNDGEFSRSYLYVVTHYDDVQDFAILSPSVLVPKGTRAILALEDPHVGDRAVVVGMPLGLPYTVTEGIVSYPRRVGGPFDDMVWMQISAPVSAGNSGGPVYNKYGEIIGIVSFRMVSFGGTEPHLGGAVHLDTMRAVLGQLRANGE